MTLAGIRRGNIAVSRVGGGVPNSDLGIVIAREPNLPFFNEIATHLAGARNDRMEKGFAFLNRDL